MGLQTLLQTVEDLNSKYGGIFTKRSIWKGYRWHRLPLD